MIFVIILPKIIIAIKLFDCNITGLAYEWKCIYLYMISEEVTIVIHR